MLGKPLSGIRVVDFSWVLAGPMTTKMLAALGAEIIKIESATRPEHTNRPPWWAVVNAGKRSCTINLATGEGPALLRRLIGISDMVVENFSTGVLGKYGLDYKALQAVRPDLIYVTASGTGREGPQKDVVAYGSLLQAYSGRAGLVGEPNEAVEAMGILPAWTDPITALWESVAILAAIRHRRRTGEGSFIDLSMLEATVALLPEGLLRAGLGVAATAPARNQEPDYAPSGCFRCRGDDAWLALSVRHDAEWRGLCAAMNRPDLADDPRLSDGAGRMAQAEMLKGLVSAWLGAQDADEAEAKLRAARVPAARSRHIAEVVADPRFARRNLFPVLADGSRSIALPWQDAAGRRGDLAPPPKLGADNDHVLHGLLGLDYAEIDRMTATGVLV